MPQICCRIKNRDDLVKDLFSTTHCGEDQPRVEIFTLIMTALSFRIHPVNRIGDILDILAATRARRNRKAPTIKSGSFARDMGTRVGVSSLASFQF